MSHEEQESSCCKTSATSLRQISLFSVQTVNRTGGAAEHLRAFERLKKHNCEGITFPEIRGSLQAALKIKSFISRSSTDSGPLKCVLRHQILFNQCFKKNPSITISYISFILIIKRKLAISQRPVIVLRK